MLATGSQPVRSELSGVNHPAVLTLRTLTDSERLAERAAAGARMLVIGTGFIGCEIAASLSMRGCSVTLVGPERLPQLERLGEDAAWGDGYDEARLRPHADGAFTVWYIRDDVAVGVLTHECDADYERGRELISRGDPAP